MEQKPFIMNKVLYYLLGGILFLAFANSINFLIGMPFWTITRIIDLGSDNNLSAWYSSLLLAAAGVTAFECYQEGRKRHVAGYWTFLLVGGLLFFMSADEIAGFHETFGGLAAKYSGLSTREFAKHSAWVWIGGPIVMLLFAVFIYLLNKPMSAVLKSRFYLVLGFALIVAGGVLLESSINWLNHENLQWLWNLEIVVEETLEMIGTICILYAFMIWRDNINIANITN